MERCLISSVRLLDEWPRCRVKMQDFLGKLNEWPLCSMRKQDRILKRTTFRLGSCWKRWRSDYILRNAWIRRRMYEVLFFQFTVVSKVLAPLLNVCLWEAILEPVTWWTDKEGLNLLENRSGIGDGCQPALCVPPELCLENIITFSE